MILVGVAFILVALLAKITAMGIVMAAFVIGVAFIVIGVVRGERL